ncbi:hypothetical protein ACFQ6B_27760 [Streptomyces wedmorensis]|uniref:Uncharacterized protein n=1 Tax=Streptomyces wedmorensis TaxID=43759 RepID=A0ABW6IY65_STRWE
MAKGDGTPAPAPTTTASAPSRTGSVRGTRGGADARVEEAPEPGPRDDGPREAGRRKEERQ